MSKEIINKNLETTELKMQFILDENGELQEISKDKCKVVEYPIKYKQKNAFEVFVRVEGTENYWISNYGRCVNNLNRKDKNTFYVHKQGKCHYTVFEIAYDPIRNKKGRLTGEVEINRYKRETTPEDLVVDAFLVKYKGRFKVWHKDGDESNNWYKNLLTVTPDDYKKLKAGKVKWQELNLEQEYIEYENKASHHAYKVYNGVLARCRSTEETDSMRQKWSAKKNPKINTEVCLIKRSRMIRFSMISLMSVMRAGIYGSRERMNMSGIIRDGRNASNANRQNCRSVRISIPLISMIF